MKNNDLEKLLKRVAVPVGRYRHQIIKPKFKKLLSVLMLVGLGFVFVVSISQERVIEIRPENSNELANELTKKVAELITLPNEKPRIMTVADRDKLKNNLFFRGVNDGDQLLLFRDANKAILYNPRGNRLVNSGTIDEVGVNLAF